MRAKVIRVIVGLVIFAAGTAIGIAQYIPNLMISEQIGNAIIGGLLTPVGFFVLFWPWFERFARSYRGPDDRK